MTRIFKICDKSVLFKGQKLLALLILNCTTYSIIAQDSFSKTLNTKPNILIIVADDLGYSDIRPFGGEIDTPVLEKLAAESMLFSNFHAMPTCTPSRAALLTGIDNHLTGLGGQKGAVTKRQMEHGGYEGYLNNKVLALPEVLQDAGYRTYHSGKWHLGHDLSHGPYSRGFQESFSLLSGGASHYADQIPLYPKVETVYERNGKKVDKLPDDFYSTKNYTDSLLIWMERDKKMETPFFGYLAYTAPHDPLHAPKKYIDKYKGTYDLGYEQLRAKRFQKLKKLGQIPENLSLPPWPIAIKEWKDLNNVQKQNTIRDMETYAAMVDYMDEQIGRIYNWLESNHQLDNTLIVFMSDNGANGNLPDKIYPGFAGEFEEQFDQSIENRGLSNSFTYMGAGWATASTSAFKYFKAFTTEGGIRTPCLIKPPKSNSHIFLNNDHKAFTHVKDIMPTVLDILSVKHPSQKNKYLLKMQGKSLVPILTGKAKSVHEGEGIGYELHGGRAYIKDDWKIIQSPMPLGNGEWALYNLKEDPSENTNLIFSNREKFKELLAGYEQYEKRNGVLFDLPYIFGVFAKIFNVLFWIIIVLFGLAILGKLSGKLKEKYIAWGYGLAFMYGLAILETILVIGLFTSLNRFSAWVLLLILGGAFLTLAKNKENWKAYLFPMITALLLGLFLFTKSERLFSLLT